MFVSYYKIINKETSEAFGTGVVHGFAVSNPGKVQRILSRPNHLIRSTLVIGIIIFSVKYKEKLYLIDQLLLTTIVCAFLFKSNKLKKRYYAF